MPMKPMAEAFAGGVFLVVAERGAGDDGRQARLRPRFARKRGG